MVYIWVAVNHRKKEKKMTIFIKAKLKNLDGQTSIDKFSGDALHIKYYRISFKSKILIYYVIQRLKNRRLNKYIHTYVFGLEYRDILLVALKLIHQRIIIPT